MKIKYTSTTCMDAVASMHLPRNVKAVIAAAFDIEQLKNIVMHDDVYSLTTLNGIGEKTAAKVIAEGKAYFAERPDEVHVKMSYYSSPMYFSDNMLSSYERNMLNEIKTTTSPKKAISLLDELIKHENANIGKPHQISGLSMYNSMPRSILSDMLNIESNEITDKVVIYRHNIDVLGSTSLDFIENKPPKQQRAAMKIKLEKFRELFMLRSVLNGFVLPDGTHEVFFSCSSGQLKKGSGYWLRKDCFLEHKKQFWGGLKPETINVNTHDDGVVMTKMLQYRALLTSAAVPSSEVYGKPILLDKMICIKELKKLMTADVLSVSDNYEFHRGVRNDIENSTHDGLFILNAKQFGLIAAQIRMFSQKGVGIALDVESYCKHKGYEKNPECYLIEDIDGVTHDVSKENWHGIINTSVFKMSKLYKSWHQYVEFMNQLGFNEFYVCSINEKERCNKRLSRQMLQTLFAATNEELEYLSQKTYEELMLFCDIKSATAIMSEANKPYESRSNIAKIISICPDAMALECILEKLNERYVSKRNMAMSGRLRVNGCYIIASSDITPVADVLFGKKDISDPNIGIIPANHCMCDTFKTAKELIALRSPHAFMEWVTLQNLLTPKWLPKNIMYFSIHDLIYRILQMDFDGDHVLVIDDEKLVDIIKRIKNKYNIPILYYEPTTADPPGKMPSDKRHFADKIVECILKCLDYNKVGQYSNLATAAWSLTSPNMSNSDCTALLNNIAVIAAGINHAVDAQKTYKLNKLNWAFVERYKFKPYHQRFVDANPNKPSWDKTWDEETEPVGNGSVDRLAMLLDAILPEYASVDVSSLHFDWRILLDHDERFNKQLRQVVIPKNIVEMIAEFGNANDADSVTINDMLKGKPIGLPKFCRLLWHQNSSFVKQYNETELEDDFKAINSVKDDRFDMIRGFIVRFMRQDHENTANMTEQEMLRYAAVSMLKNTFMKNNLKQTLFILQCFGDIYAEAAARNIADGYVPKNDNEFDNDIEEYSVEDCEYLDPAMVEILESGSFWLSELNDI